MKNKLGVLILEGVIFICYLLQVRYFFRVLEAITWVSPSFWWLPAGFLIPVVVVWVEKIFILDLFFKPYNFFLKIVSRFFINGKNYHIKRISFGNGINLAVMLINTIIFAIPYYILRN